METISVVLGDFCVQWHPGKENIANHYPKHTDAKYHVEVHPVVSPYTQLTKIIAKSIST